MAEAILKHKLNIRKIKSIKVDSAGFEPFHVGDEPDNRTIQILNKHHISYQGKTARLFKEEDFDNYDMIYFMDDNNYFYIKSYSRNEEDLLKTDYIMNTIYKNININVPDPYFGGVDGFENVYQMLDAASDKIIEGIIKK